MRGHTHQAFESVAFARHTLALCSALAHISCHVEVDRVILTICSGNSLCEMSSSGYDTGFCESADGTVRNIDSVSATHFFSRVFFHSFLP